MMASPEDIIQIQVVEWVRQCTNLPVIHIANQRKTNAAYGSLLKRMGVKKGVSDLFFPRKNKFSSGLWLEIKTESGRASKEQIEFMKEMRLEGYAAEVAYSADEAVFYIASFYGLNDFLTTS